MKNTIKALGIIALAAVIGFTMAGCVNPADGVDGTGSGAGQTIGATVELSNLTVSGASEGTFEYGSNGVGSITSAMTGGTTKVQVTGGKLTINLYTPMNAFRGNAATKIHSGVTSTPADAVFFYIQEFENNTATKTLGCYGPGSKQLKLIWADKDATLGGSYTMGPSTFNFSGVSLKQGWNFLIQDADGMGINFTHTATRTFPSGYTWQVF